MYIYRSLAYWGGIERILVDKMNALVTSYGDEVCMLTYDQGDHTVPYQLNEAVHLIDLGVQSHHQYRYRGLQKLWVACQKLRLLAKRMAEQLQQIRPDIIVCAGIDHAAVIARLKGDVPMVIESHNICQYIFENKGLRHRLVAFMFSRALLKIQAVVALTEGDACEWRKRTDRVWVIPNLVHLNHTGRSSDQTQRRVIFVGRFDAQKRVLDAIRIWQMVYPQFPDWQLDIYGEGEEEQQLVEATRSLQMNIHIHRPTLHIFDCYCDSAFLVLTSRFEPFGLVMPEAMSCGLPVVAYDVPYGPASIITDGKDGFVVPDNDAKAFADRMCLLMGDASLRKEMGQAAMLSAQRYKETNIMPLWKQLFGELASPAK